MNTPRATLDTRALFQELRHHASNEVRRRASDEELLEELTEYALTWMHDRGQHINNATDPHAPFTDLDTHKAELTAQKVTARTWERRETLGWTPTSALDF